MAAEWITLALGIAKSILEKMPNYSQKKKEEFYELEKRYLDAMNVAPEYRDDNLIGHRENKLRLFMETFKEEIRTGK